MLSSNPIVSDLCGHCFELVTACSPPSDARLEYHALTDTVFAAQFVAQLNITEHQWLMFLGGLLSENNQHQSMAYCVAALVMQGAVTFFKLPRLDRATPFPFGKGKALVFMPSVQHTQQPVAAQKMTINTRQDAEALVNPLNHKQVAAALIDTGVTSGFEIALGEFDLQNKKQQLIDLLINNEAWVWKIDHRPHMTGKKAKTEVLPGKEIPGNRKVPLGPETGATETVFKRKHPSGPETDPYTLQEDGKPLGAKAGLMPKECTGLKALPANHDELVVKGYPNLNVEYSPGKFTNDYANFSTAEPDIIPSGTKIYRIVDEAANPAGSYRATELPQSKAAWRGDYAVKDSWNGNGFFAEYTVPEGDGLKVWRGKTAGQRYEMHKGKRFYLEGGSEQVFVARNAVSPTPKKLTNWSDSKL